MIDVRLLMGRLSGAKVPRPNVRGTLSGHAAGEPFCDLVFDMLQHRHGASIVKQHELLNMIMANPPYPIKEERVKKFPVRSLGELMWHGRLGAKWSPESLFSEKQYDFADIIDLSEKGSIHIIDVKTRNASKKGQPPNIMSALRLAKLCKGIIEHGEASNVKITYVGVDWLDQGANLECVDAHVTEMMKIPPEELYINFTAALQIQFHVDEVPQTFNLGNEEWARRFLQHYIRSWERRKEKFEKDNVLPFLELLGQQNRKWID